MNYLDVWLKAGERCQYEPPHNQVFVYCPCANEASAAIAARRLKRAGFNKFGPFEGELRPGQKLAAPLTFYADQHLRGSVGQHDDDESVQFCLKHCKGEIR
jgi:hypothetical protein